MEFIFQENNNPYASDPRYAKQWQEQIDHILAGMAMNSGSQKNHFMADPSMKDIFRVMERLSFRDHYDELRNEHGAYGVRDLDISAFYSPDHFLSQFKRGLSDEDFAKFVGFWRPKLQKGWERRQKGLKEGRDYSEWNGPDMGDSKNPWWVIGTW